jgi:predicted metal-dependent peptidase
MYTAENLKNDIRKLTRILPQVSPFFYVLPFSVVTAEEWAEDHPLQANFPSASASASGFKFADCFMESLPENKRLGLLLHEVFHPALGHVSTKWTDTTITPASFHQLSNMAMDIVIEHAIYRLSAELSPDPSNPSIPNTDHGLRLIHQNHPDEKCQQYHNLSWREVYTILRNQATVQPSDGVDYHDGFGSCEESEEKSAQWQAAAEESKAITERLRSLGNTTASTIEIKNVAPELPWTSIMRDHLQNIPAKINSSWDRIKRRPFSIRGEYVPHKIGTKNVLHTVAMFMDTSGSMREDLDKCAAEVSALLWQLNCKNLILIEYDTKVCSKRHVEVDENAPPFIIQSLKGGGGTSLRDSILQLIEENDLPGEDVPIICLTDGGDVYQLADLLPSHNVTFIVYGGASIDNDIGRVIRA